MNHKLKIINYLRFGLKKLEPLFRGQSLGYSQRWWNLSLKIAEPKLRSIFKNKKKIHSRNVRFIKIPYSVQDYSLDETITSMLDQLQTEGQCCGMADWSEFNSPSVKGWKDLSLGSSEGYDPLTSFELDQIEWF